MRRTRAISHSKKLMNGSNKFFIVGLRRSGTSIFRNLVLKSPGVSAILFEPHEILHAVGLLKIARYKKIPYYNKVVSSFNKPQGPMGAKFALNPGIDAIDWVWLQKSFPQAKFLFITRNVDSNWNSYNQADANTLRGVIPQTVYKPFHKVMNNRFVRFNAEYPKKSIIISYELLRGYVDREMGKVWNLLGVKPPNGSLKSMIKRPKN